MIRTINIKVLYSITPHPTHTCHESGLASRVINRSIKLEYKVNHDILWEDLPLYIL